MGLELAETVGVKTAKNKVETNEDGENLSQEKLVTVQDVEAFGWHVSQDDKKLWQAEKQFDHLAEPTKLSSFFALEVLLAEISNKEYANWKNLTKESEPEAAAPETEEPTNTVIVSPEEFDEFKNKVNVTALTRSKTDGRKKEPIKTEIIEHNGNFYIAVGTSSGPRGEHLLIHKVVSESDFDGETTAPEEWEKRGVGNFIGIRVLGSDEKFYVTTGKGEFEPSDNYERNILPQKVRNEYFDRGEDAPDTSVIYEQIKNGERDPQTGALIALVQETDSDSEFDYSSSRSISDFTLLKTLTRNCLVVLTRDEKISRSAMLGSLLKKLDEVKKEAKRVAAGYKADIENLEEKARELAETAVTGAEYRDVECWERFLYGQGIVEIVRKDNGDVADTREMTLKERQTNLFI